MTGLCGWQSRNSALSPDVLAGMAARLPQPVGKTERAQAGRAALAAPAGQLARDDMLLAGYTGRPRWRDTALEEEARAKGHAAALLSAWRSYGSGLMERLKGQFSLAVLDGESGAGIAATDRVGCEPLAYAETADGMAFATGVQALRAFPGVDDEIPLQALLTYLFHYVMPAPSTIYAGMAKLRPAECLDFSDGGGERRCYHVMQYATVTDRSPEALAEDLRRILRDGMTGTLADTDPEAVGAFLSGGLDSSTVTALLAEHSRPAQTFTIGFDEAGYDESGYARIVAEAFGTAHHEYFVTPADVAALIPQIPAMYDEPYGNHSAVPAYYCARAAREAGVEIMLAGDGGDELFAGNERYLSFLKHDWYRRLPSPLRHAVIEPISHIPGFDKLPMGARARGFFRFAGTPLPDRLFVFGFFMKEPLAEVFDADRLSALDADATLDLLREAFHAPEAGGPVQRMMHMDMNITLADNDLRKVNRMTALAGVDVRFPMLDDDLIDFAATVPESVLVAGGRLRGFFKDALRDMLPREVIEKRKQGFGLPFARWVKTDPALKELVDQALLAFGRRNLLRQEFLDRVRASHHRPEATLVDGFAWDIMMLELWLQKWHPVGGDLPGAMNEK